MALSGSQPDVIVNTMLTSDIDKKAVRRVALSNKKR